MVIWVQKTMRMKIAKERVQYERIRRQKELNNEYVISRRYAKCENRFYNIILLFKDNSVNSHLVNIDYM